MATILRFFPDLPKVLRPLMEKNHWVTWKSEDHGRGKNSKVPYQVNGKLAKSSVKETWCSYEEARSVADRDGIGFVFLNSGFVGLDLDNCRNEKGQFRPWALELMIRSGSYCEVSPSGTGVHIIGYSSKPPLNRTIPQPFGGKLEIYRNHTHYMTITGKQIGNCDQLQNLDDLIDYLTDEEPKPRESEKKGDGSESGLFFGEVQTMIKRGWSVDRIEKEMLKNLSKYHADRYHRQDRLRREIQRIYDKSVDVQKAEEQKQHLATVGMDQIEEQDTDWIWYPYLARGELTLLDGDPGVGKSYLAQMVGKHLVDGELLESVRPKKLNPKAVAFYDVENDPARVTKKRLLWNGCKNMKNFKQCAYPFSIDDEVSVQVVYEDLKNAGKALALVVFDTGNHYVGNIDMTSGAKSARAMWFFKELARQFNCAVLVLRHLTKSSPKDMQKALYRGQGNAAIGGVARIVLTVGYHPQDKELRVLCSTKENLSMKPPALTFLIESKPELQDLDRSIFEWGDFNPDLTSDDLVMTLTDPKEENKKIAEATKFLKDLLKEGPMIVSEIYRKMEGYAFSRMTLQRAARKIIVKKGRTWALK
jgi:RecA-family ATPase